MIEYSTCIYIYIIYQRIYSLMIESPCSSVNFSGIPTVQSVFTPTSVVLGLDLATSSAVRSAASAASEHLEEAMLAC